MQREHRLKSLRPWLERHLVHRWPALLTSYVLVCTVGFASWALVAERQKAGIAISWPDAIVFEALIYVSWAPFAFGAWLLVRRLGLTARCFVAMYLLTVVGGVAHAVFVLFLGGGFDWDAFSARLPIDLLLASGIAVSVAAIRAQRRSAEEAARAAGLQLALEEARRGAGNLAPERLLVSTGSEKTLVAPADVEWFGAAGNYVVVNWNGREGLIRDTLGALSKRLNSAVFVRTHRSTIVNLAKVRGVAAMPEGGWVVRMESGAELVVSRTYRDDVLKRLS